MRALYDKGARMCGFLKFWHETPFSDIVPVAGRGSRVLFAGIGGRPCGGQ